MREGALHTEPARLDQLFHALADPHRRAMVTRLAQGPAAMSELAIGLGLALPSALKHLQVLEKGGMVASTKQGRTRTFALDAQGLAAMQAWLAEHQRQLGAGFDRLDALMRATPEKEAP
ncbi:metalloregulator ArsR/SmtB family transcription factor [Devosia sp.]|uniref:ArsR/SmtB family transcription factor n=1 Tax=Devosia sp. TaxID=1871048 RepID=UPI002AFF327A|nr:metalloregulator ArsR/SmtB family transcription factor [Devosia sp.]